MVEPVSELKITSKSMENDADMVDVELTIKNSSNSDRELSTSPKLVVQSKDDSQDVVVKKD